MHSNGQVPRFSLSVLTPMDRFDNTNVHGPL